MESSLQSISRPVIDRLPVQLDEFACRQLDRVRTWSDTRDSGAALAIHAHAHRSFCSV